MKRASLLVHRFVEEILAEGWRPGDFVGAVHDLAERYGVSPPIIREAVRLTEHMQIGEVRRGASGGLFVKQPGTSSAAVVLRRYFAYSRVDPLELAAARRALLHAAASLAIERMTEADLRQARDTACQVAHDPYALVRAIGETARNRALAACLGGVLPDRDRARRKLAHSADWLAVNEKLASSVALGDAPRVARSVEQLLEAEYELVGHPPVDGVLDDPSERTSLSEQLALALVHEMDKRRLAPGEIVGSEEALTERLQVSRAALREGLRILEYHNVAVMRPGPGGGLVVGEPSPDSVVEVVSIQLDLMSISPRDIHELRRTVELPAVEAAARDLSDEMADHLRRLVTELHAMTPEQVNDAGYRLFIALADASGNRPLATFARIAMRLQSERVEQFAQAPEEKRARTRELAAVQRRIAEAVLERDPAVARHRLLRHLEEVHRYVTPVPALPEHRRSALAARADA